MIHYLKIDDIEIQNTKVVIPYRSYRSETRVNTISGGESVDRGLLKFKITAIVSQADKETFALLESLMDRIIVNVQFYYNGILTTAQCITSPLDDYALEHQNDDQENPLYSDIKLIFNER